MQCSNWDCYSITSSARARTVDGTVRPIARAVVRLIDNSNLLGCSTGTGQPLQKIEEAERDFFMTAEMAKDFGLVDKAIDHRPEIPPLAVVS